jgi:hypothetical protein
LIIFDDIDDGVRPEVDDRISASDGAACSMAAKRSCLNSVDGLLDRADDLHPGQQLLDVAGEARHGRGEFADRVPNRGGQVRTGIRDAHGVSLGQHQGRPGQADGACADNCHSHDQHSLR